MTALTGDRYAVLLGGRQGSKPLSLAEAYALDTERWQWTALDIAHGAPKSRYKHTALWLPQIRSLLVFGGHGGRSRYFNDLHLLCFGSSSRSEPLESSTGSTAPASPSPSHSSPRGSRLTASSGPSTNTTRSNTTSTINASSETDAGGVGGGSGGGILNGRPGNFIRRLKTSLSRSSKGTRATSGPLPQELTSYNGPNERSIPSEATTEDDDCACETVASAIAAQHAYWRVPSSSGTPPSRRAGHTTTLVGESR